MIGYVTLGSNDIKRAAAFYDALPAELGATPLRTQFLGTWAGEPCFSAEVAADTEAPPEMLFRELRALYGRMASEWVALAARAVQIMEFDRTHHSRRACAVGVRV